MTKTAAPNPWLHEVEVLEDRLEAMKLALGRPARVVRSRLASVVRSTAGLLKGKVPSGVVYERRIRRSWEQALHRHAS